MPPKNLLYKENMPIRTIVNFTTAPGYKVTKKLLEILQSSLEITNNYSVKKCIEFVNKIKSLRLLPQYRLMWSDIVNLYSNVPMPQTVDIVQRNLERSWFLNQQNYKNLVLYFK